MLRAARPFLRILGFVIFFFLFAGFYSGAQPSYLSLSERKQTRLNALAEKRLEDFGAFFRPWRHVGAIGIDSLSIDPQSASVKVFFHPNLTHLPIRHAFVQQLEAEIMNRLGRRFRKFSPQLICRDRSLYDFIPNAFRETYMESDLLRVRLRPEQLPLVKSSLQENFFGGLSGNHIALWHSHGLYFDNTRNRWQWQRARLFGTVEDIFPMVYVTRYITPMLEKAGAVVLLPRERDTQRNEVIVDLDGSTGDSELIIRNSENSQWEIMPHGFAKKDTLFDGENPFKIGNHLKLASGTDNTASLKYIPDFPEDGYYAVHFSWQQDSLNATSVEGVLQYAGGSERFMLNQTMGGGTWVYLGTYFFSKGKDASAGSFEVFGSDNGQVTADALRFGGGMGNVARKAAADAQERGRSVEDRGELGSQASDQIVGSYAWKISQRPRYHEGARYYLQYAGMPDSLVYNMNAGRNDYNDDFMSRGEWVNYLMGGPLGPTDAPGTPGLNIPVDLALSFHTDAGITSNDSVIGTLAIYNAQRDEGLFRDGVSKLASRDLTDLVQSQIVNDIRLLYNENWTRRALWDRQYSEAWRPQVPAMLLELLSHQNLADMRYGIDPRFQFGVSRAIYKGVLRFVAANEGREAIVQPLPPQGIMIEHLGGKRIRIGWQLTQDPLEPSAVPQSYKVYQRNEGLGFDTGTPASETFLEIELPRWNTLYCFRVSAINEGGESFPSETLSVALMEDQPKTVLVVNAFTRISGPAIFDNLSMAGLAWWDDQGVSYHLNASYTGHQFDFDRSSPWLHDDSPGWGASHADMEEMILKGNTFDFTAIHGAAIRDAGYSFVSASRKALEENRVVPSDFWAVSIIFGEQLGVSELKEHGETEFRVFTPGLMNWLRDFNSAGGHVFASGAYIGTDMIIHNDSLAMQFAKETLGYIWRTNHASNKPDVFVTDLHKGSFPPEIKFNTSFHPDYYIVEAPDAIEPASPAAQTLFRYGVNQTSAGVIYRGNHKAVSLGFPFEAITDPQQRLELMKSILRFFEHND
jgi:hypothetical protein